MKYIYTSLAFAILLPFGVMAKNSPPEEMLLSLVLYHGITEYRLPLAKNIDFFVQNEVKKKKPYGGEAACFFNDEEKPSKELNIPKTTHEWRLSEEKLQSFFAEYIEPKINREPENVRIFRNDEGEIIFEGAGNFGQKLDVNRAIALVQNAIKEGVSRIELPVEKTDPSVTVEDAQLREMGITKLVSLGESDFTGSSSARMFNIEVGASKFDGHLIPQGTEFSFNNQLGAVNGKTGYTKELIISGSELKKEYGGGVCQVSSTAYRAALLSGLPILERYPHSFAVRYYQPWGTDATIYPGSKDMRFQNDTKGALLIQTTMSRKNKILRFHFYGTKDNREVKILGMQTLGNAKKGFSTTWVRVIMPEISEDIEKTKKNISKIYSRYKPSVDFKLRSVTPAPKKKESPVVYEGSTI